MGLLENGNVSHQFVDLIPLQSPDAQQKIAMALIPYFQQMSLSKNMNPLLARVLAIESPHNKVFLDYLMFNFDRYLADPSGSRTILMILKRTQYQKFIDHCIDFIEKRILEPSKNSHAAACLMTQLFDLNL